MSLIDFSDIPQHLKNSQSVLIVLNDHPSFDEQLAAAGLLLVLQEQIETVLLAGPSKIENPTIAGLSELKTELGHKNLVVTFDYIPESVNNVSYHIDEDAKKFYLTIKPEKGHKPLDRNSVELEYAGAEADLVFLFGVSELDELGKLYYGYEDFYQNTPLVAFSKSKAAYAEYPINCGSISSVCEAVFQMLHQAGVEFDSESATNLLAGIQYETKNFVDPTADADTFEAVSHLLRAGARRRAGAFSRAVAAKQNSGQVVLTNQHQVVREEIEPSHKKKVGKSKKAEIIKETKPAKKAVVEKEAKSPLHDDVDGRGGDGDGQDPTVEIAGDIPRKHPQKPEQIQAGQQDSFKQRGSSKTKQAKTKDSRDSQPVRPTGLRK